MNVQLICDGNASRAVDFTVTTDTNANQHVAGHGTATIDKPTLAFVQELPIVAGSPTEFQVKSKVTKSVVDPTDTVTITFNLIDTASGIALPPASIAIDLIAPQPPAQLATHTVISTGTDVTNSTATDPGTATITVNT